MTKSDNAKGSMLNQPVFYSYFCFSQQFPKLFLPRIVFLDMMFPYTDFLIMNNDSIVFSHILYIYYTYD